MAIISFNSGISSNSIVDVDININNEPITVAPQNRYSISGNIYFAIYNIPLDNVKIDLYNESHILVNTTNSVNSETLDGYFNFVDIPAGKYYLEVDQKDFIPLSYYSYNMYFDKISIPIELTKDIDDLSIRI